jgi:hypothetical protein
VRLAAGIVAVAGLGATANTVAAQAVPAPAAAVAPHLVIRSDSGRITVGDRVTLRVRFRLVAGEQIAGATPGFREPLPDGIRLLRADSLQRDPSGDESGALVVAFFRPGIVRLPPIAVTYRAAAGAPPDTAVTGPFDVSVTAVVPEGSGTLRDIKNIETAPISLRSAATIAGAGLVTILALLVASRLQRRRAIARRAATRTATASALAGPYDAALARLAVIAGQWAARRDVESHYAETADVLRRYLAEAHGVPALERTTPELLGALPGPLSLPTVRDAAGDLLGAADLVKFARYAPAPPAPAAVVGTARSILSEWAATALAPDAGMVDGAGDDREPPAREGGR